MASSSSKHITIVAKQKCDGEILCGNPEELDSKIMEKELLVSVDTISQSLKALNRMAKRPPVDIEFKDLVYSVPTNNKYTGKRSILKGISGSFKSGELTAIMGPSGAGKSSLMNILVGYTCSGITGDILVNGQPRKMQLYHKISSYIMQDDLMQPYLTVQEAMQVAAHLKLGSELGNKEKLLVVEEVLSTLGLVVCRHTRTERLSGGQRKRLAVALELVNNPPIIFLDEPTSGLDVVSIKQCISLLKILANHGRTIICTIHQPSASIFSLFDNVYMIAKGRCVYQGAPMPMVEFMGSLGFHCPTTHNPADFILETLQGDEENITKMTDSIQNGRLCHYISDHKTNEICVGRKHSRQMIIENELTITKSIGMEFPTTFCTQFLILVKRMLIQKSRSRTSLYIQMIYHLMSGGLLGGLFYNIGNDATMPMANFKLCLSILVMFSYNCVMTPILIFPAEVMLMQREYFNRWYGLKPYYLALTIAHIPANLVFEIPFLMIAYYLSGQPMDIQRFVLFCAASMLCAFCSEGFGLAIGALFSVTNGAILGPSLVVPPFAMCIYGIGFGPSIETAMRILMKFSYLRFGMVALITALYQDREDLYCPEELMYCHYSDPNIVLRDLGMGNANYLLEVLGLLVFTVFYRIITFVLLRYRLQTDLSNKFLIYLSSKLRRK